MTTKQKAIKDLFESLKAKEILIADVRGIFDVADNWVVRFTWEEDGGYERDVISMYETSFGSISIEFDEWDDNECENYSTMNSPDEVVVYSLFKETDIDL
jgi:hypothetical protein